jgi:hypothetical protein
MNVNWGKLKRTIERDFKRNPAKTGVLLALLPVAAYFIGPLCWKLLPKKGPEIAAVGTVALAPVNSASQPPIPTTTAKPVATRWLDVAAQIATDTRMASAALGGLRNPFEGEANLPIDLTQQKNELPTESASDEQASRPEDFGLQLTATIVGKNVKLATINGKQYRENATLPILHGSDSDATAAHDNSGFIVKRVAKKYVVLEREGKLYQLKLSR